MSVFHPKEAGVFFSVSPERIVSPFVEALLPRGSGEERGFVMSLDIWVMREDGKGDDARKLVHLLFHRPRSYTKVLWAESDGPSRPEDFSVWELKCNHDSCWRTDGISTPLNQLALKMGKQLKSRDVVRQIAIVDGQKFSREKIQLEERDKNHYTVKFL